MSGDDREIPTQLLPYVVYLSEAGYRPRVDDDRIIRFKVDGATHLLVSDPRDAQFFHLVLGFRSTGDLPLEDLLRRANTFNALRKVVKAVVDEEDLGVTFHFEGYLFETRLAGVLIEKSIDVLRGSPKLFFQDLRDEPAGDEDEGEEEESEDEPWSRLPGKGKWEKN
jgi:hypothetical protein